MSEIKFSTSTEDKKKNSRVGFIVLVVAIALVVLVVLFNCFSIVNEGFVGVKYQFGKITEDNLTAGLNFCIPFIEEIQQVDIREQVYSVSTDAYTSDTQTVKELQLKLNYYYDRSKLSDIIRNIGVNNVETKLLVPNVAKITKNEIGKVQAEVLVQSRDQVQTAIQNSLTEVLAPSGIIVTAFALENLSFDSAFEESIQAKVIAAQDALKMENKTKEKEEEAKQVVIAAQAQADATKVAADAQAYAIEVVQEKLENSPNYIEDLKVTNWNGVLPQVMGSEVNPFVALDGTTNITPNTTRQTAPSDDTAE